MNRWDGMAAYYNEFDRDSAAWLRELIKSGLIAPGDVDERSIVDVQAADLLGYRQHHFYAGVGVWSYALRCAGWPDDRPVWTMSCPCPPFSAAGKKKACPACGGKRPVPCPRRTGYFVCCHCEHAWFADARHLWPESWRLISEFRPSICLGEQVSGADGKIWLSGVRASLEVLGFGVGGADLPAAGVESPQRRERLYWMAYSEHGRQAVEESRTEPGSDCGVGGMANANGRITSDCGVQSGWEQRQQPEDCVPRAAGVAHASRGDTGGTRLEGHSRDVDDGSEPGLVDSESLRSVAETGGDGFWSRYDILPCLDGKSRRIEPGSFPLVARSSSGMVRGCDPSAPIIFPTAEARGMRLRGYGNSIVAPLATEFIRSVMETIKEINRK